MSMSRNERRETSHADARDGVFVEGIYRARGAHTVACAVRENFRSGQRLVHVVTKRVHSATVPRSSHESNGGGFIARHSWSSIVRDVFEIRFLVPV